ncbi:MAG: 4Fe-4S binding protein [Candidatus Thermoplasmatota archaeon]|nr:4Fe-4S binding protein [Candidatus Thermoplasmatota archaeon]
MRIKPEFVKYLEENGCFGSVVSIDHLEELGQEISSLHDEGLLDDSIYNYSGKKRPYHTPRLPKSLPRARSIIIVSTPQPMIRTTFNWENRKIQLLVPPTYFDAYKVANRARLLLKKAFEPRKYRFVRAMLPLKLLAVRSGLALYGRNNITYIPAFGSFHRPTAFYSDYDSPVDNWQEKKALPLCDKCKACIEACPTKAIREDRFLVSAETCLTYLNEKPASERFSRWIDASAHNALIGCMRCQMVCPYNKELINWYDDREEFTEEESAYLLEGKFSGERAARIEKKLKRIGLDLSSFPRNLEVLLQTRKNFVGTCG